MTPDLVISGHNFSDQARVQIRQSQEEIFRLKTEDSRLRLEAKSKDEDVEASRIKLLKSEEDCSELRRAKKELEFYKCSLEEEMEKRQNSQVSLESQVGKLLILTRIKNRKGQNCPSNPWKLTKNLIPGRAGFNDISSCNSTHFF